MNASLTWAATEYVLGASIFVIGVSLGFGLGMLVSMYMEVLVPRLFNKMVSRIFHK